MIVKKIKIIQKCFMHSFLNVGRDGIYIIQVTTKRLKKRLINWEKNSHPMNSIIKCLCQKHNEKFLQIIWKPTQYLHLNKMINKCRGFRVKNIQNKTKSQIVSMILWISIKFKMKKFCYKIWIKYMKPKPLYLISWNTVKTIKSFLKTLLKIFIWLWKYKINSFNRTKTKFWMIGLWVKI